MGQFLVEVWIFLFVVMLAAYLYPFFVTVSSDTKAKLKSFYDTLGKWLAIAIFIGMPMMWIFSDELGLVRLGPSSDDTSEPGLYHGHCGPVAC